MAIDDYYRQFNGSIQLSGSLSVLQKGDFVRADVIKGLGSSERRLFASAKKFGSLRLDDSFRGLEIISLSGPSSSQSRSIKDASLNIRIDSPGSYVDSCPFPCSDHPNPDVIISPSLDRPSTPSWVREVYKSKPWQGWSSDDGEVVFPGVDPITVSPPSVSIAVPVYGKPDRFVPFFKSLLENTKYPNLSKVVIVNDGSDEYSTKTLEEICSSDDRFILLSQDNCGYLRSANRAIGESFHLGADYVVTCNTDILVTPNWLSSMVRGAIRNNAALVNPLSNQQALISLPMSLERSGGMRRLSGRVSYLDAALAASFIPPSYPDAVTNIGNCMLIERSAWQEFGPFDEDIYGDGYGEECELWARLRNDGRRCIVADDCYVYHESHGTMEGASDKERDGLNRFLSRWRPLYNREVIKMRKWDKDMDRVRSLCSSMMPSSMPVRFLCYNIGNFGGVQCVVTLVNELTKLGFDATVEYALDQKAGFKYLVGPNKHNNAESMRSLVKDSRCDEGVIVATHWFTGEILHDIMSNDPKIIPLAFWQDREDLFVEPNGDISLRDRSVSTYTKIPNRIVNAKWVGESAKDELGISSFTHIPVGVNTNKFYPGEKRQSRVRIVSMYRPETPRRGGKRLERIFKDLKSRYGDAISLETFGSRCTFADVDHSKCSQDKVAQIMRSASIVFEPSDFQGFGLPGLEAMASGCALVSTDNLGIHEYGIHSVNCFIANRDKDLFDHICELVDNPELVSRIGESARESALDFDWSKIAIRWANHLNELYARSGFQKYHPDPLPF